MEFPDVGAHCSLSSCNRLDFLPFKCNTCSKVFCENHYKAEAHKCPNAVKDNQVTVCPLCRAPITVKRGNEPDLAVSEHLDNDCQSNLATFKKTFARCSQKGCKIKEVVPIICKECTDNFCIKHRHPRDHNCGGHAAAMRKKAQQAAMARQNNPSSNAPNGFFSQVQGTMSDDEAFARALALSMQDSESKANKLTQEEMDNMLARQLQATPMTTSASRRRSDRCNIT